MPFICVVKISQFILYFVYCVSVHAVLGLAALHSTNA